MGHSGVDFLARYKDLLKGGAVCNSRFVQLLRDARVKLRGTDRWGA